MNKATPSTVNINECPRKGISSAELLDDVENLSRCHSHYMYRMAYKRLLKRFKEYARLKRIEADDKLIKVEFSEEGLRQIKDKLLKDLEKHYLG